MRGDYSLPMQAVQGTSHPVQLGAKFIEDNVMPREHTLLIPGILGSIMSTQVEERCTRLPMAQRTSPGPELPYTSLQARECVGATEGAIQERLSSVP